ncbi:YwqJ-related putative deaminase [Delftia tsuruhatensis]|uniref:YwqJ-related putative deaminase n=1 Tax=Delftia tsuruhatensis TaxID=180282 RepID=UPI001E808043|nr:YwqJ-related putative deaminase [Delftia tsuruhatensis]CAC9681609.1 Uncharacterised protein [Delftia tsuruhatensis]
MIGKAAGAGQLRGNYASEIGLAIAALPQAARSAVSTAEKSLAMVGSETAKQRVVARALAQELQAAEPVLAAKAPEAPQVHTVDVPKGMTRWLLDDGDKLETAGKRQPDSKTAPPVDGATGESSGGLFDKISNETAALRSIASNNTSDASKILHQRINLKGAVLNEYSRLKQGLSNGEIRNEIGPVLAGVMDARTGNVYFGTNKRGGELPSNFVPEIAERMPEAMANPYFKTHGAGSHAEIHALNDAFHARPSAVMSDFHLYTINSGQKKGGVKKNGACLCQDVRIVRF